MRCHTSTNLPKHKRHHTNMINPLPKPPPFRRDPRPRKSIIHIHAIHINRSPLTKRSDHVAQHNCKVLIVGGRDGCGDDAGEGVVGRLVFWKGEVSLGVVDCCVEAFVVYHFWGSSGDEMSCVWGKCDGGWVFHGNLRFGTCPRRSYIYSSRLVSYSSVITPNT